MKKRNQVPVISKTEHEKRWKKIHGQNNRIMKAACFLFDKGLITRYVMNYVQRQAYRRKVDELKALPPHRGMRA